ncbi:RecX family transcriptional regulator [Pedobacter sp. ISL-68]|uniref:regulatory protein RecX n=1 Tax=unclassified Pedobacter TaxID=2628915 RepID=UPI001BEB394B|nr:MULTISPECIES: regulatory protein RecX [unclassified Pedobacter]MBT2560569.1 RecX family transcriptional regulator [Pedobacter sp. ISL-64]MBT2589948.1 RecX family transcriptional regulator [Pedobacter sp. ISL-68]
MKSGKQEAVLLDKKQALVKAKHFCAYQERSQKEVRYKLVEWGMRGDELEEIISELILNNFLNEERFAKSYASGKFNIKHWGRVKIKQGLKLKGVPDKILQKAIYSIDDDNYLQTIEKLVIKKVESLNENDPFKRKNKLMSYLQAKGFETDLILLVLKASNLN